MVVQEIISNQQEKYVQTCVYLSVWMASIQKVADKTPLMSLTVPCDELPAKGGQAEQAALISAATMATNNKILSKSTP